MEGVGTQPEPRVALETNVLVLAVCTVLLAAFYTLSVLEFRVDSDVEIDVLVVREVAKGTVWTDVLGAVIDVVFMSYIAVVNGVLAAILKVGQNEAFSTFGTPLAGETFETGVELAFLEVRREGAELTDT